VVTLLMVSRASNHPESQAELSAESQLQRSSSRASAKRSQGGM
jgi:hypothetical protein